MNPLLIEINQDVPGLDRFIGSWLCRGDRNVLVDVGPANSARRLVESLEALHLERLDYVLLTHIHIDHAGGLAGVLDHFPMAKVICHEKGIRHLVDPAKLWEGSLNTLGEIAKGYGKPEPVMAEVFIPHTEVDVEDLMVVETPGHAPHHLSFCYLNRLFAGEAGGNYFELNDRDYLRPATPPRFFLEEFLGSVDRLRSLKDQRICFAHFGEAPSSHQMLTRFREQLIRWADNIREVIGAHPPQLVEECVVRLLERDPDLKAFSKMGPERQQMERYFISNAVRGYVGFFEKEGEL
ncbi:MBL fold metallo-hydrolase [Thermodesulfobacteriota bacterium]